MKTKHNTNYMMSACFGRHQKPGTNSRVALCSVLKHLNMSTVAMIMFVALALVSNSRGNKTDTTRVTPCRATSQETSVDNFGLLSAAFITPGPLQNTSN
ncbi:MAG TPA: hypothetical protein VFQ83_05580 [Candidatus Udaeobacter sp.]|jgi:hypothetical protein|nr:hypothetical protein [Candidatus Udaeobacter sp.]